MRSELQGILPKCFAARWLALYAPVNWTNQSLEALERQVHEWIVTPAATEGDEKAEVTAGGVVDVTGHVGGFNFPWPWASGAAAGRAV